MATIQWRPEVNALTVPQSYKMRYLPKRSLGTDDMATEVAAETPGCTPDMAKSVIRSLIRRIQANLINGNQVTLEEAFIFGLSFTGRLDSPDAPLPPIDEMLQVKIYASAPFIKEVRHQAQIEKVAMSEKAPVINMAEDTRLRLSDVLYADGVLRLTGSNMFFDPARGTGECVIEGTRSGRAVQSQFGPIANSSLVLVPDIPAQDAPFNNEYILSLAVRYTANGTLRSSTYRNRLRSPLTVLLTGDPNPPPIGILTGSADSAYASVIGGVVTANERVRIQAVHDMRDNRLLISLLDMQENAAVGTAVSITANGQYTLQGFANSAVSHLRIKVSNYAALTELARNYYYGRIVDILDIRTA